jgi:hypothetical protein
MRKIQLVLLATLISFLLLLFGIELLSNFIYFSKRGHLFYLDTRDQPLSKTDANSTAQAVFHPYISYIHRVGRTGTYPVGGNDVTWTTNNVGFQVLQGIVNADPKCCDYPSVKRDGEVVVGIFGGSVASGFALTVQGTSQFADSLARIPEWSGKKFRFLNFAMPGFKQPQQLIALAYYLSLGQHFDVVLNIDGFNEVVTSHRNWSAGVEPSFPADTLWGDWGRTLEKRAFAFDEGFGDSYLAAYLGIEAKEWNQQAENCITAACFVIYRSLGEFYRYRASRLGGNKRNLLERSTLFPNSISSVPNKDVDIFSSTANQWASSSRLMATTLRNSGALYMHVIQPNQWLKTSGDYQPIDKDHIYKWVIDLVNDGYPRLLLQVPALVASGVPVYDATMIFRGLPARELYSDDCCHFTEKGAQLFATGIAKQVTLLKSKE